MCIFTDDHESGTYLFIGRWTQKSRNRNLNLFYYFGGKL